MKRRSQSISHGLLLLMGAGALVLALVLSLRGGKDGGLHLPAGGGTLQDATRLTTLEADQDRDGGIRRRRFLRWQEERRAALDLARKMAEKQKLILSDRMIRRADEPPFPPELIEEAGRMKAGQLRVMIREIGRNAAIRGPNRAMIVAVSVDAWLKQHERGGRQSLREALEIITEVMPTLPKGFDTLPVSCAMGRSLRWDPEQWTGFLELHWNRWSGPRGDGNAEVLRRMLLEALEDPQLRMRVEKLPKAGNRP